MFYLQMLLTSVVCFQVGSLLHSSESTLRANCSSVLDFVVNMTGRGEWAVYSALLEDPSLINNYEDLSTSWHDVHAAIVIVPQLSFITLAGVVL